MKKTELEARIVVLETEVATLRKILNAFVEAQPRERHRMEWYPPVIPDPHLGRGRGYYDQFGTVWW